MVAQPVLLAAAITIYLLVILQAGSGRQDFATYMAAANSLLHGAPLYTAFLYHPFPDPTLRPAYIYPPAFGILVEPFALLPAVLAPVAWTVFDQLALVGALILAIRWMRPSSWAVTAIVCATATFYPLWIDAVQGQANLPIVLLVTAGVAGVVRGDSRFAIALGVAAALKLTPGILLLWLLLERRFRAAAWMLASLALVTAVGALARFDDSVRFFEQVLPALARGTAFYANQSPAAVVDRVLTRNPYTDPWLALGIAPLVVATCAVLLVAYWFWSTRDAEAGHRAAAFLPLVPLLSTVTWPHHLVILLPVIWVGIAASASHNWAPLRTVVMIGLLAMFSVLPRWSAGPAFGQAGFRASQTGDPLVFLSANGLFLATLVLFLLTPWLLRAR